MCSIFTTKKVFKGSKMSTLKIERKANKHLKMRLSDAKFNGYVIYLRDDNETHKYEKQSKYD